MREYADVLKTREAAKNWGKPAGAKAWSGKENEVPTNGPKADEFRKFKEHAEKCFQQLSSSVQNLGKQLGGKGGGKAPKQPVEQSGSAKCGRCGGVHADALPQSWCPNRVAKDLGIEDDLKTKGVKCTWPMGKRDIAMDVDI